MTVWIQLIGALATFAVGAATLFHGATYLLWYYEKRVHGGPAARQPLLPRLTAWIGEWLALLLVMLLWPFGLFGRPKVRIAGDARPIVLVPDWGLTRSSLAVLAARLRRDGRDAYPIQYPSLPAAAEPMAAAVATAIAAVAEQAGATRVDVLAHGHGGVLVRAAARHHGSLERLGNVVTLGCPHGGTALAQLWRGPRLAHLRPGSRFLVRLLEEDPLPAATNFAAIYSTFDAAVFPPAHGYYPEAFNVTIDDVGHMGLLFSERVYLLAKENLDIAPPCLERAQHQAG